MPKLARTNTLDPSKAGSKDAKGSAAQNYFVANRLDHLIELVEDAQTATLAAYKEIADKLRDTPVVEKTPASLSSQWPRQVGFQLTIKRLFDLDTVEQTFGAQLFITMRWECPCTEDPPLPEDDDGDWVPLWTPKYRIKSLVDEQLKIEQYTTTAEDGVQYCVAEIDHFAIISEELELEAFPVDCQDLTIELESSIPAERVIWVPINSADTPQVKLQAETCLFNDFSLLKECQFIYNLYEAKIGQKRVSTLQTKVKVVRSSTYYLLNVALMVFLLGSFVLCPWALHPGDIPSRFNVDFSLILTMVAFRLVLASMLPRISYVTMLDTYLLGGFLFMACVTVCHAVLPNFYIPTLDYPILTEPPIEPRPYEDALIAADRIAFYSCAAFWVLFNLAYGAHFRIVSSRGRHRFLQTALKQRQQQHDEKSKRVAGEWSTTAQAAIH